MIFDANHAAWIEAHAREHLELLLTLAKIPAPSNFEEKRAEFILNHAIMLAIIICMLRTEF